MELLNVLLMRPSSVRRAAQNPVAILNSESGSDSQGERVDTEAEQQTDFRGSHSGTRCFPPVANLAPSARAALFAHTKLT